MGKQHTAPAALCLLALAAGASAHIRLINDLNGAELFWAAPSNISIVISAAGSDNIANGSHFTALRNAGDAWNDVTGTTAQLVENTTALQQARTDWEADDIHLVYFDETNSSGFFGGSGAVAITWIEFFSNGVIADADVLFNGIDFLFTTSGQNGRFDVQDIATHELGHLLGLDHSGWAGGTMYPYVDAFSPVTNPVLQRSLSLDEVRFLREAYPLGAFGSISGSVLRASNMTPVIGAHVTALDADGATAAGDLTDDNGDFILFGLEPATYTVNAGPLDSPVSSGNISSGYTVQTNFEATQGPPVVAGVANENYGDLLVGADATASLGQPSDILPLRGIADGMPRNYSLAGVGLEAGSTLTSSNPSISIPPGSVNYNGTSVQFAAVVAVGATSGHVDLILQTLAAGRDVLPAAFEITPPDPVVTNVAPRTVCGDRHTLLTISGSGFNAGARVVIGPRIYRDGTEAHVLGSSEIQLTTTPTPPGQYEVVVIDETGVEGRLVGTLTFQDCVHSDSPDRLTKPEPRQSNPDRQDYDPGCSGGSPPDCRACPGLSSGNGDVLAENTGFEGWIDILPCMGKGGSPPVSTYVEMTREVNGSLNGVDQMDTVFLTPRSDTTIACSGGTVFAPTNCAFTVINDAGGAAVTIHFPSGTATVPPGSSFIWNGLGGG